MGGPLLVGGLGPWAPCPPPKSGPECNLPRLLYNNTKRIFRQLLHDFVPFYRVLKPNIYREPVHQNYKQECFPEYLSFFAAIKLLNHISIYIAYEEKSTS